MEKETPIFEYALSVFPIQGRLIRLTNSTSDFLNVTSEYVTGYINQDHSDVEIKELHVIWVQVYERLQSLLTEIKSDLSKDTMEFLTTFPVPLLEMYEVSKESIQKQLDDQIEYATEMCQRAARDISMRYTPQRYQRKTWLTRWTEKIWPSMK